MVQKDSYDKLMKDLKKMRKKGARINEYAIHYGFENRVLDGTGVIHSVSNGFFTIEINGFNP